MVANSGKQLKIHCIASVAKTKFKVLGAVVFLPFFTLIRNLHTQIVRAMPCYTHLLANL